MLLWRGAFPAGVVFLVSSFPLPVAHLACSIAWLATEVHCLYLVRATNLAKGMY
jgi:hypothetical protein